MSTEFKVGDKVVYKDNFVGNQPPTDFYNHAVYTIKCIKEVGNMYLFSSADGDETRGNTYKKDGVIYSWVVYPKEIEHYVEKNEPTKLKVGDTVKLVNSGYIARSSNPVWGKIKIRGRKAFISGVVLKIEDGFIIVEWSNGYSNRYYNSDLKKIKRKQNKDSDADFAPLNI